MAEAYPADGVSNSSEESGAYHYGLEDSDDALTADFRVKLGLLSDDEEGLTEKFKASIGLLGDEAINEIDELELMPEREIEATLKQFKIAKFCKSNFSQGQTFQFSKDPLKEPLIAKKNDVDRNAALAVWIAIQRFMGDIPTPTDTQPRDKTPMMTKIYRALEAYTKRRSRQGSTSSGGSDEQGSANGQKDKEFTPFKVEKRKSWKKMFKSGKDKDKSKEKNGDIHPSSVPSTSSGGHNETYLDYSNRPSSQAANGVPCGEMDIIHFIVGHGILRRDLRDEIYCQICKQLQKNSGSESCSRGWMLQALCAGCFLPTEQLSKYLKCFLKDAPSEYRDYAIYTRRMLRRTMGNGMRYHPPNWLEYQATKMRKYVMLPVAFADGQVESVEADSATTASDMCHKLATVRDLKDTFGFSMYICIYDKVSSLGSGLDHVMDAISECEQVVRAKGAKEEDAPWRLFFRKELFTPWHDPCFDEVATTLIYMQLVKGIRSEEYRTKSEEELTKIAARRWYIEQGSVLVPGKLQSTLHDYLPKSALTGTKSRDGWTQAIMAAFDESGYAQKKTPVEKVKWAMVMSASKKWPLQFAGLFEAFRIAGPRLPRNEVVIAVSSSGFFVLDEPYKVVMALHFYEIVEVFSSRAGKMRGQSFSIITIKGDEYTFISPNSETIAKLVMTFLEGLRKRSRWAVGLEDFILQDHVEDEKVFKFSQGDVIELIDDDNNRAVREDWLVGRCEQSRLVGEFPYDSVYVLPSIDRPPDSFLGVFASMTSTETTTLPRKRGAVVISKGTIGRHALHGLDSAA